MAYDPSDLSLPPWLLRLLDRLVALRIPMGHFWHIGMTRAGALMFFSLLGLWAAALYSGNNLLYLCGAMLSAIAIAALWQGIQTLRHCPKFGDFLPDYMEHGQAFILRQHIAYPRKTSALVHVSWATTDIQLHARLSASQSLLMGQICVDKRQYTKLQNQHLKTSAPLGLWEVTWQRQDPALCVVLPQPVTWLGTQHSQQDAGQRNPNPMFEGDEYHDLRAYAVGDSPSRIHWRKSTLEPASWRIKHFSQHTQQPEETHLRVDLRLPTNLPDSSAAFEALLGRAWYWLHTQALSNHDFSNQPSTNKTRLILGQQTFDCSQPQEMQAAIHAIADAKPEKLPPISFSSKQGGGILLSLVEAS